LEHIAADGKVYSTQFYNLDAILSVGYRVNRKNATLFRRWANQVLKEYMLRGYAVNQRIVYVEEYIDKRLRAHEQRIENIEQKIDFFVRTSLPPNQGIFYDGQIFDAYTFHSTPKNRLSGRFFLRMSKKITNFARFLVDLRL